MPSTDYDTLAEQIGATTADDVLSDKIFAEIFTQENEVYRQHLINKLRAHAKELGVSMKAFDSILSAHRKFSQQYEKDKQSKQNQKLRAACHTPDWLDDTGKINEVAFCKEYLGFHEMKCINGLFYGDDGSIPEEQIENSIQSVITPFVTKSIAKTVKSLVAALKMLCYSAPPELNLNEINLQNGTLALNGTFLPTKKFCVNRLNVEYHPGSGKPELWIKFLSDLLIPEDVLTLQEYLGYCLVPTTQAQVALFLIGNGGEGKSIVATVAKNLFGNSSVSGKLEKLETDPFAVASMENKLLFIDDEMQTGGLKETQNIKQIITARIPMQINRKNVQPYEAFIYSRILALGNAQMRSLFDHSDGFLRRQLIIRPKPKPADRIPDLLLDQKILKEKPQIFNWCFQGLQRLIKNNYQFTLSDRTKANLEEAREDNCNVADFLENSGYIKFNDESEIASTRLVALYQEWCRDNAIDPLADRTMINYVKSNAEKYSVKENYHVLNDKGRRCRGFSGIQQSASLRWD